MSLILADLSDEELELLIESVDSDNDGQISLEDFRLLPLHYQLHYGDNECSEDVEYHYKSRY